MSAKQSIYIDAPVEKVFDYCANPRASWSTGSEQMSAELLDVTMTKEGVGTYYSWAMKFAGLRYEGFDVYTEFVPNKRFVDRSSASFAGTWTYDFEPEGSGTRLTVQRHPASFWALPPVDWFSDRVFVAPNTRKMLEAVKAEMEKPAPVAAVPAQRRHTPSGERRSARKAADQLT